MSVSFERAGLLLAVIEKAAAHASQYSALIGAAGIELSEMNAHAQKDIDEHNKRVAAAEARAKAEEEARRERQAAAEEARAKAEARTVAARSQPVVEPTPEPGSIPHPTPSPEPIARRPIAENPNVS